MRHLAHLPRHSFARLLLTIAALAVLVAACTPSVVEFTIGECVNLPDGEEITDYDTVDCAEPHDAEVFALPQMPDGEDAPFNQTAVSEFASQRCQGDEFANYVGTDYESSAIWASSLTPSQDSWDNANDREIVCLLVGEPLEDGSGFAQLTGSKQNSGE
ncbi:septum formation family protein [Euzebya tangerina]|uniref:septum formation family protein n=1 Tax=Euzebya tangerina TaxID=591198 RepID=UPI0013C2C5C6|nr:septum formation family protein [Euzebya tangerina]